MQPLSDTWLTISFYVVVIGLILVFRKRFQWQGIVGLAHTNIGLKQMKSFACKHKKVLRITGWVGIVLGFTGMFVVTAMLFKGFYIALTKPSAQATFVPVLPGVKVPGSPVKFPLFKTLIAIFIAVVVHEFSHGLLAVINGIKIKSSGLALFGPLPGAFVELDEKKLEKQKPFVQHSVFAAGPLGNMVAALAVFLILNFAIIPLGNHLLKPSGFEILEVAKNSPAEKAGLKPGMVFQSINEQPVFDVETFRRAVKSLKPNDTVVFKGPSGVYNLTAGVNQKNTSQAFLGITITWHYDQKLLPWTFATVFDVLKWVFIINIGLGLANLLPIGPLDGGRMLLTVLTSIYAWFYANLKTKRGKSRIESVAKRKALKTWNYVSIVLVIVLLITIALPMLRNLGVPI